MIRVILLAATLAAASPAPVESPADGPAVTSVSISVFLGKSRPMERY